MQIIVSLRLFEIESTRAGVTPRIITPLKLYPGRFWESTPPSQNIPPPFNQLYVRHSQNPKIYPGIIWEGGIFSDFTPEVLVLHIPLILANVQIVMQIL